MVRIKQTGKAKANGTPKVPLKQDPESVKSPTQPTELSETDRSKIKVWLDKQEKPFGITTAPLSRKRKRSTSMQTQTDLFEERLNVQYEVKPKDKWECLRRYKKFTVGSESIAVGQCILVKHDDAEDGVKIDVLAQWKAKVLEVRALDSEHVYIRVSWLNRPEDLGAGRKPYHGRNELIPSNQMDVIDAMAVNGSLDVKHWDEKDDDSALIADDLFFWRQTYDFANSKTFSALRQICIDSAPQNPDEMIIQCGNKDCRKWQHVKCIAQEAAKAAAGEASGSKKSPKNARPKDISISTTSSALAKAEKNSFTAEVFIQGLPDADQRTPSKNTEIVITTPDGEKKTQHLACLFCAKEIE